MGIEELGREVEEWKERPTTNLWITGVPFKSQFDPCNTVVNTGRKYAKIIAF